MLLETIFTPFVSGEKYNSVLSNGNYHKVKHMNFCY